MLSSEKDWFQAGIEIDLHLDILHPFIGVPELESVEATDQTMHTVFSEARIDFFVHEMSHKFPSPTRADIYIYISPLLTEYGLIGVRRLEKSLTFGSRRV